MEVVAACEGDALVMVSPAPPTPWTVLLDDNSSGMEVPPATPLEEELPLGPLLRWAEPGLFDGYLGKWWTNDYTFKP